jgi:hypothetical protein
MSETNHAYDIIPDTHGHHAKLARLLDIFADIDVLRGARAGDPDFLRAAHRPGSREKRAVDHCLKGPEIHLPEGGTFRDKEGVERRTIRVRWWDLRPGLTLGEVCMPEPCACPEPLKPRHLARVPDYPADAPPVIFGHYWLPPAKSRAPLRPNQQGWHNLGRDKGRRLRQGSAEGDFRAV